MCQIGNPDEESSILRDNRSIRFSEFFDCKAIADDFRATFNRALCSIMLKWRSLTSYFRGELLGPTQNECGVCDINKAKVLDDDVASTILTAMPSSADSIASYKGSLDECKNISIHIYKLKHSKHMRSV